MQVASCWRMFAGGLGVVLQNCRRFGGGSRNKGVSWEICRSPGACSFWDAPKVFRVIGTFYLSEFRNATILSL